MDQSRRKTEPGNLVMVNAGNYLTVIKPGELSPAQVLLKSPTVGLVIEETSNRKIILVQERDSIIFASPSSLGEI